MTHELQVNANRFMGFADIYEKTRPAAPRQAIDIILRYLNRKPACVVDLGCGTGLSTFGWAGIADEIIGIEPSHQVTCAFGVSFQCLALSMSASSVSIWFEELFASFNK